MHLATAGSTGGYANEGGAIYVNYSHGDEAARERFWGPQATAACCVEEEVGSKRVFACNNVLPTLVELS